MLGLYLHIPFCAHICSYCNFNRGLQDPDLQRRYVRALVEEIRRAGDGSTADTIFFGGGTPSLLDPDEVAVLVDACRQSFDIAPGAEVTLETNPETVARNRVTGYLSAGVNRVSLGVQSFDDAELGRLGRQHSASRVVAAVADLRESGVANLSLDLMLWLPQQTMARWQATLERAVDLGPDHLSLYLLELYPNAPLREEMARRQWSLAPDDDAADMYLWAMSHLDEAGYAQYEISNVARPGRESRHNIKYWADGEWLGFGCGAHSTRGAARWHNIAGTAEYVARIERAESVEARRRAREAGERIEDALFTGLRLTAGVDLDAVGRRYGVDVWSRYADALEPHARAGRLRIAGHHVSLTRAGMLVANDVMAVFV